MPRKPYPTDFIDEESSFAVPYLTLMNQHAPQREHGLREVFNALRWLIQAGAPWCMLPNDLLPWAAVYQQSRRRLDAHVTLATRCAITRYEKTYHLYEPRTV